LTKEFGQDYTSTKLLSTFSKRLAKSPFFSSKKIFIKTFFLCLFMQEKARQKSVLTLKNRLLLHPSVASYVIYVFSSKREHTVILQKHFRMGNLI
jgi:hypothetical protein